MDNMPSDRARELLAAEFGEHPQWAEMRRRILTGSCEVHSDVDSLVCALALRAITAAIQQEREECAKVAENRQARARQAASFGGEFASEHEAEADAAGSIAAAIRARNEHKDGSNG